MPGRAPSKPRCAAIVGPYLSGKTALLEALLYRTGAIAKKGEVSAGTAVGDRHPAAQAHDMSVELTVATTQYLGDEWTFIDCPGSVEFQQEGLNALKVVDVAIVVCEPEAARVMTLAPLLHFLDQEKIPHLIFINKIDQAKIPVRQVLEALSTVSDRPLVMREVPFMENGEVAGFVDLVSERAWHYRPGDRSEMVPLPAEVADDEHEARSAMVEALADFDDALLEQILEEMVPEPGEIYEHMANDLKDDLIVPVFFGSAEADNGISRLLKALRHETPEPSVTAERLGLASRVVAGRVFKTVHESHVGKLSWTRVFAGTLKPAATIMADGVDVRLGTLHQRAGAKKKKVDKASLGQVVAVSRVDELVTGALIGSSSDEERDLWRDTLPPLFSWVIEADSRSDQVKLASSLHRLVEDDPSLGLDHDPDTHELLLRGQGEVHLSIALERLADEHGVQCSHRRPHVGYRETIRKGITQHARFKRQTGGHGQFGDVKITFGPNERGEGLAFTEHVVGGTVPRRFIPAVEKGVVAGMAQGPLGFPLVDIKAHLIDGQHHAVDSSEVAFKTAAMMAMREALVQCEPVLLEPIHSVEIVVPNDFTSRVQRVVSQRRGQITGFVPRPGWRSWDRVTVLMPEAELWDLILEVRALTLGVGTFTQKFDHLQPLSGRLADEVVAAQREILAVRR